MNNRTLIIIAALITAAASITYYFFKQQPKNQTGESYRVAIFEPASHPAIDEIVQVEDEESFHMARRLVREQGLLVGASSGSAVLGAIKHFSKFEKAAGPKKNALVILVDSCTRYLSKHLNDSWMIEKGFSLTARS